MKLASLAVVGLSALISSGCIPAPYGLYYQPSYPDPSARTVRASCGGQAGPPSRLEFELARGLAVQLDAGRATAGSPEVELRMAPRAGSRLQFAGDTVSVSHDPGTMASPALLSVLTRTELSADAVVDPAAHSAVAARLSELGHGESRSSAEVNTELRFAMPGTAQQKLRLQWPSIRWADGTTTVIPPIDLEAQAYHPGWLRYYSAEERATLQARFEQCRLNSPKSNCHYLLDSYENGFTVAAGPARLTGRVLVTDVKLARADVHLSVSMARSTPWRWASADAVLADLGRGTAVVQPMPAMRLLVSHRDLPLSTPLAIPVSGSTRVRLDVPLPPAGAASYSMQLPELGFDQATIRAMPIRLERRALDAGIEPFNC